MLARGIDEVLAMYDRLMANWSFFVQFVHSGVVQENDGFAQARWTMQEMARSDSVNRSYNNLAFYDDAIEQRNLRWRFTKRRYCYVWHDDTPIAGRVFPLPRDFGMP